ncbi:MAG: hypothetical protein DCC68_04635 [Planctomycetota bacterium]|nr:MAG: hypothetical protein DCC68_04635 [Planctomycetota bacterium]
MSNVARSAEHRLATFVAICVATAACISPAAAAGPIGNFPRSALRSSALEARPADDASDKAADDRRLRYAIKASAAAIVMLVLVGGAWLVIRAMRPR